MEDDDATTTIRSTTTTDGTRIEEETWEKDEAVGVDSKKKRKRGLLARVWKVLFGRRGEDYEKRLQYLSKAEASIHSRRKRRAQRWRKTARNVVLCSVFIEVVAVVYAVLTTRAVDLNWQMRALRVLPMFAFPGLSYAIYFILGGFTRMRDRNDQKTLENLRAERQSKINELKEKTNYYTTQQLIQRYDLDPAAKAAAAAILASKLGADSGLKMFLGDDSKPNNYTSTGKSNDVELSPTVGLRNRKHPKSIGNSGTGSSVSQQSIGNETTDGVIPSGQDTAFQGQRYVEHYRGTGTNENGWIARLASMLVGEDPSQSYALICGNCRTHNGLAIKEEFPYITYYCPNCHALNGPKQSDQLVPTSPGSLPPPSDDASIPPSVGGTSSVISEVEGSSSPTSPVQEPPKEAGDRKSPPEM